MVRTGLAALALALAAGPALAEVGPEPDGTVPADPRDFSGVWMNDNTYDETLKRLGLNRLPAGETFRPERPTPVLTPDYARLYAEMQAAKAGLEVGVQACGWPGLMKVMTYPYPLEILHSSGRITMIFEAESQVRRLFLDRDEHLPFDELDPSYNGDSIARWEGDTLVVDTVGLNDLSYLPGDRPHSDQMHVMERFRYIDGDTMEVLMTVTDPLALAEPFEQTIIYSRRPDWRIREYSCMENNRDAPDSNGERAGGIIE